jgi:actin-related protein 5
MPTEEELAAQAEKRKEQGRRLQEIAAEKRKEKMESNERDLEELTALREDRGELREKEWLGKLAKAGFDNEAELEDTIKKLDVWVKKARKKEAGEVADEPMELKEKKKQRLLKSGWEFRVRAKKEKEREREEREAGARREEEERNEDLEGWAKKLRGQQEKLMGKIKDRERRKNALGDRKSAAAQARMKVRGQGCKT